MKVNDHYENIRRIYHDFLKNSNMLDLIDVYNKCSVLTSNYENHTNISPVSIFLYNSIFIKGLQRWHMEVPRQIGVKLELQLSSYIIAAAMPDPSIFCNLHWGSWQCPILNPMSGARDGTCVLMDTSCIHYRWATMGTPKEFCLNQIKIWLDFYFKLVSAFIVTWECFCFLDYVKNGKFSYLKASHYLEEIFWW